MIVTPENARSILKAHFPNMTIVLRAKPQIAVRPINEESIGLPTLIWHKLDTGRNSAVRIGKVLNPGEVGTMRVDWNWVSDKPIRLDPMDAWLDRIASEILMIATHLGNTTLDPDKASVLLSEIAEDLRKCEFTLG